MSDTLTDTVGQSTITTKLSEDGTIWETTISQGPLNGWRGIMDASGDPVSHHQSVVDEVTHYTEQELAVHDNTRNDPHTEDTRRQE